MDPHHWQPAPLALRVYRYSCSYNCNERATRRETRVTFPAEAGQSTSVSEFELDVKSITFVVSLHCYCNVVQSLSDACVRNKTADSNDVHLRIKMFLHL